MNIEQSNQYFSNHCFFLSYNFRTVNETEKNPCLNQMKIMKYWLKDKKLGNEQQKPQIFFN